MIAGNNKCDTHHQQPSVMFLLPFGIGRVQDQPPGKACAGDTASAVMPVELVQSLPSKKYSPLANIANICSTSPPEVRKVQTLIRLIK